MNIIGYINSDFPEKFGVPRQSGLAETTARIFLEPPYNHPDAVRGLEEFSHIWLLWQFSENLDDEGNSRWSPTVRPPRLGGNRRKGVFATRSPFRPNPIGMSCVKLDKITFEEKGPVLHITGADMVNGTPLYDIKPYIPYADSHPEASGGFSDKAYAYSLKVQFGDGLLQKVEEEHRKAIEQLLSQDPRPSYQEDSERVYGMSYADYEIKFKVDKDLLTVVQIERKKL